MTESLNWFLRLLTCKQMSMVPLGTHHSDEGSCVYPSLCAGTHRSCSQGPGRVSLRELSLAVQATMLGEVISPFIVQDKSVTASIRTTVDNQCL